MYLLPKPKTIKEQDGQMLLCHSTHIVMTKEVAETEMHAAKRLQEAIRQETGLILPFSVGEVREGDLSLGIAKTLPEQTYEITIDEKGGQISGGDGAGVLYGVETFCQIVQQCGGILPCVQIQDAPDMPNRGYYFDQTRGRVLKLEELKKIADRMCRYKLNQLQLYVEHTYLFRDFSEMWRDQTPLTAEEILELDSYCRERHIELVPSLASFGHLCTLLSTKTYGDLCEMEDSWKEPFSFWNRMRYHTINVSDERSLPLIKKMIAEYMQLFSSNKFNICADETFCLGKYKSKKLAEERGVHRLYIDYVKELAQFLVENGKIPMFWGDIICAFPEAVQELPKETICLNWGYDADWPEDSTRKLSGAGARLYNCPGVSGWDQLVNQIRVSYENISRMCHYAVDYHADGVLNTDWGDCGHINHPDFSLVGMIYGAAFSWNPEIPAFDEINRQISRIAYGDVSETLVSVLAKISVSWKFTWRNAVDRLEQLREVPLYSMEVYQKAAEQLEEIKGELYAFVSHLPVEQKKQIHAYLIALQGMILLQKLGMVLAGDQTSDETCSGQRCALAEELEYWLYDYKALWRSVSRESELFRIQHVICCYADWLRS